MPRNTSRNTSSSWWQEGMPRLPGQLGNGPVPLQGELYECINAAYLNAVSDHALETMKYYWNANADCDCCGGRGDIVSCNKTRRHNKTPAGKGYCTTRYSNYAPLGHACEHWYACEHCIYITNCFKDTYVLDLQTMKLKQEQLQLLQDARESNRLDQGHSSHSTALEAQPACFQCMYLRTT